MADSDSFSVRAPATVGHLGPGFGVLGMALDLAAELRVELDVSDEEGVWIERERADDDASPEPMDNRHDAVFRGLTSRAEELGLTLPASIELTLTTAFPHGVGLGSTAAEYALGIVAADELAVRRPKSVRASRGAEPVDESARRDAWLELLVGLGGDPAHGAAVCGGGLAAAIPMPEDDREADSVHRRRVGLLQLPIAVDGWVCAIVVPELRHATADVHRILPPTVSNMVMQRTLGRLAGLVAALDRGDESLLRASIADEVHVPLRKNLTPGLGAALDVALEAGAAGVTIAGHGPAVLAMGREQATIEAAATAMEDAFAQAGVEAGSYVCRPVATGVQLVDEKD